MWIKYLSVWKYKRLSIQVPPLPHPHHLPPLSRNQALDSLSLLWCVGTLGNLWYFVTIAAKQTRSNDLLVHFLLASWLKLKQSGHCGNLWQRIGLVAMSSLTLVARPASACPSIICSCMDNSFWLFSFKKSWPNHVLLRLLGEMVKGSKAHGTV